MALEWTVFALRARAGTLSCAMAAIFLTCDSAIVLSQPAAAPSVQVENRATTPIQDLYVKKSGSREWGKNALDGSIAAGGTRHVTLEDRENCRYDVRIVFQDGRSDEMSDVDLCQGLAVTDKPGGGDTPEKASTSGSSGWGRLLNR